MDSRYSRQESWRPQAQLNNALLEKRLESLSRNIAAVPMTEEANHNP